MLYHYHTNGSTHKKIKSLTINCSIILFAILKQLAITKAAITFLLTSKLQIYNIAVKWICHRKPIVILIGNTNCIIVCDYNGQVVYNIDLFASYTLWCSYYQ